MLTKSRRSAMILSAVAVLTFTITSALVNILLPYLVTQDMRVIVEHPERLSSPGDLLVLALITLIALLGLVALGAYWLYRFFGEAYYGPHGAARWALFGLLLALLLKLPAWALSESLWLVKYIVWTLSAFAAFFIARWLVPLHRKTN